jgi:hypothetical protein
MGVIVGCSLGRDSTASVGVLIDESSPWDGSNVGYSSVRAVSGDTNVAGSSNGDPLVEQADRRNAVRNMIQDIYLKIPPDV